MSLSSFFSNCIHFGPVALLLAYLQLRHYEVESMR
jgi:hypothetical protein